MRLTLKLLVALTVATLSILGVDALLRVRREVALFDRDVRRDGAVVSRLLARAVGDAWRVGGERSAAAILDDPGLAGDMQVRWVWLDQADRGEAPRPALSADELARVRRGETVSHRSRTDHIPELVTLAPVSVPDGRLGAIEIVTILRDQQRYVAATIRYSLLSTAVLIAALAAAALTIGMIFIGRPTQALVAKARRIAAGDLGGPLAIAQRDELGHLAGELNAMCDRLEAARTQTAAAVDARIAAVEQLRHADRLTTIGQLASGIAHELGTPLNVVTGRAQMIASGELVGDEVADSARIIHEQARRMASIVRQLMDFARSRPVQREPIGLRGLAERSVRLVEAMARERGATITIDPAGGDPVAFADEGQLQQALLNIVINALHAVGRGGTIEVAVDTLTAAQPADRGAAPRPWVRLRVRDTGVGMDPATMARIFEPFFTTKGVGEGTGLGLSVTYGIVRDAGGWIDVESAPGAGSVFALHLPPAPPGASA